MILQHQEQIINEKEERIKSPILTTTTTTKSATTTTNMTMMYLCYICGKEYGSKSIAIHEKQCLVKHTKINPKKKIIRPPLENAKSLQERNAMANRAFQKNSLVKCIGCHRTFQGNDKLKKHQTGCKEYKRKNEKKKLLNKIIEDKKNDPACIIIEQSSNNRRRRRPLGLSSSVPILNIRNNDNDDDNADSSKRENGMMHLCYLCGREYTSNSIERHERKCLEIKKRQMEKVPKRPPFETASSLWERNDMARKAYESTMMVKCIGCERTFNGEDKLRKHQKGCHEYLRKNRAGIRDCIVPGGGGGGGGGIENYNLTNNKNKNNTNDKHIFQLKQKRPPLGPNKGGNSNNNNKSTKILKPVFRFTSSSSSPACIEINDDNDNNKPTMHVCYICGREYGSKSIGIHEKQCYELKMKQSGGKKLLLRPPLEQATSLRERNDMAQEAYETQMKEQCPGCKRTFDAKDKLLKHMKGCDEAKKLRPGIRDCIVPGEYEDIDNSTCQIITTSSKSMIDQHLLSLNNEKPGRRRSSMASSCASSSMISLSSSLPPNIYLCYVCGRQYGSNSIAKHERKCLELHNKQQELLPPTERKILSGPPPDLPPPGGDEATRERRNSMIREFQKNEIMEKCIGCSRTFAGKAKLQKHMKGCDAAIRILEAEAKKNNTPLLRDCIVPDNSQRFNLKGGNHNYSSRNNILIDNANSNSSSRCIVIGNDYENNNNNNNNKMHVCYICGREYGSKSIAIHEKQCRELFLRQQEILSPSKQKDLPERPAFYKSSSLIERNAMAKSTFESLIMETCLGCHRTFYGIDKLKKHQKGCTAYAAAVVMQKEEDQQQQFLSMQKRKIVNQSCRF